MAYVGNLVCNDCGLTFTARWGSFAHADEYRCENDHILHVEPESGEVIAVEGAEVGGRTLADLFGRCPLCSTELACGRLPCCPVCNSRDHQVLLAGTLD
jgi:hypothetical protein